MSNTPRTDAAKAPLTEWRELPAGSTLLLTDATVTEQLEAENAKLRLLLTAAHQALVIPHVVAAYTRNHGHHDYQVLESGIRSAIQT